MTPFTNSNGDKTNEEKVVTTQPITVKQRRALMVKVIMLQIRQLVIRKLLIIQLRKIVNILICCMN